MTDAAPVPWQPLQRCAAIGLVLIAVLRCCVSFTPHIAFDNDPAVFFGKSGGLGPAGSLWLDGTTLLLAGMVLLCEWKAHRRVPWLWIVLGALPIPIVFRHGLADAGDLWRGVTWVAAIWTAMALAHAARDPWLRPMLLALAIAVVAPLILRGVAEVSWEHDATVRAFEENRETILADRGWAPDSASARIFERRLTQRQPDAWFISTNIFATFMVVGMIGALGLWRAARERTFTITVAAIVVAGICGVLLFMTGSKGGLGVALLAVAVLFTERGWSRWPRVARALPMLLACAVLLGIVGRGVALPEGFLGEKSLLFRWHYFNAAASAIADQPLGGTGPDGFQRAATEFRHPRNPEETAFTHSVFVDWLATLGILGASWTVLLALMCRVRRGHDEEDEPRSIPEDAGRAMRLAVIIGSVVALGIPLRLEAGMIDQTGLLVRVVSMLAYGGCAWLIWLALHGVRAVPLHWLAVTIVSVLLMHGQMELTLTDPSSCLWAFAVIGLALPAAHPADRGVAAPVSSVCAGGIPIACAMIVMMKGSIPAGKQEAATMRAARVLWTTIAERNAGLETPPGELEKRRLVAAAELELAALAQPTAVYPLLDAAREYERAALLVGGATARGHLDDAARLAREAVDRFDSDAARVQLILVLQLQAQLDDDPAALREAVPVAEALVDHDPLGIAAWKRLGDLHWELGDIANAREAYEHALANHASFALDPMKQLSVAELRRLEGRLSE